MANGICFELIKFIDTRMEEIINDKSWWASESCSSKIHNQLEINVLEKIKQKILEIDDNG